MMIKNALLVTLCTFFITVFSLPVVYINNNDSHFNYNDSINSTLGGCIGTYFGCCNDSVTYCMNMNCTNCLKNTM